MSKADKHGQPNIGINYHANVAKALNELIGICRGIAANDVVTVNELLYLSTWLNEHTHLRKDGDYLDLMDFTTDIASSDDIDMCDLEELLDMIQCVLDFRCDANTPFDNPDVAIGRLIGLCRGMLADDVLDDKEIFALQKWMEKCNGFIDVWPIYVLHEQIQEVLTDGVITEDERATLFTMMAKIVGGTMAETGAVDGLSSSLAIDEIDNIEFEDKEFCLTGRFAYGSRNDCKAEVVSRGGVAISRVTRTMHYLVIGSLSSRDWKQSSHGRKIEKAVELRKQGLPIKIVHEDVWVSLLNL
mgnify:CR=1 FL=1